MSTNAHTLAISTFTVYRYGKVVDEFSTYEEAWALASTLPGAIVKYFIPKNCQAI